MVLINSPYFIFYFYFILNFLFTVAPSTKGGCFSGGRGIKPNYNVTKKRKNFYHAKLEQMNN